MSQGTYKEAGVDYGAIDPLKVLAQRAARKVVDAGDFYLASVSECLLAS